MPTPATHHRLNRHAGNLIPPRLFSKRPTCHHYPALLALLIFIVLCRPAPARAQEPTPFALTLDNGVALIEPGQAVTYAVQLQNEGTEPAQVRDLRVMLPPGLQFVAASTAGEERAPGVIAWAAFNLDGGGQTVRTVSVQAELPLADGFRDFTVLAEAMIDGQADDAAAPESAASITLTATEVDPIVRAAIDGAIWHDLNGDGLRDENESGLAGVTVQLTTPEMTLPMQTSDSRGAFAQSGLGQGEYSVSLTGSALADFPLRTGVAAPTSLALTTGVTQTLNFGYARPGRIAGQLWREDSGVNGRTPLANVRINLHDASLHDAAGNSVAVRTTSGSGAFQFVDQPPGRYLVSVATDDLAPDFAGIFEADGTLDQHVDVALASGAARTGVDFGVAFVGQISGQVWRDANENGRRDGGEGGIANVTVAHRFAGPDTAFDTADDVVLNAVTKGAGGFALDNLTPGRYRLEVISSSWNPQVGVTFDPDGVYDGRTELTVAAGQSVTSPRFGYGRHDLTLTSSTANARVTPGEVIVYTLRYANAGAVESGDAVMTTTVPVATRFHGGASTLGWSCADGAAANSVCELALGVLGVATQGEATFAVQVDRAMPAGVNLITNSVELAERTPGWLDGTPNNNRATLTATVDAAPSLFVDLTVNPPAAAAGDDARRNPGDEIIYTVAYANRGNQAAAGVTLALPVPANANFDAATSAPGWQCADGQCTLAVGELPAGAEETVRYGIRIAPSLPVNVSSVSAVVTLRDAAGRVADAAALTPVESAPDLEVHIVAPSAPLAPGMPAEYMIDYTNAGNQDAIGVLLVATVPQYTTFSKSQSDPEWDCVDGSSPGAECILAVGALAAGVSGRAGFTVTVDAALPPGVTEIRYSVVIVGAGVEQDVENNADGGVIDVTIASSIDLLSFTAAAQADGTVLLRWATAAERATRGFVLYRGTSATWTETVRITPTLITAQGTPTSGANYVTVDTSVRAGVRYYYWLQELALDNGTVIYGPIEAEIEAASNGRATVYLPLVQAQ